MKEQEEIFKDEDEKWYCWTKNPTEKHGPYETKDECELLLNRLEWEHEIATGQTVPLTRKK
ncbi:unnamed protein product [marine sediment metagenome]|uniref:Uncharacterized protein n=1 Tax=marine sediment metagenome TaxID=412755 RepID=X0XY90_9ZZZZ